MITLRRTLRHAARATSRRHAAPRPPIGRELALRRSRYAARYATRDAERASAAGREALSASPPPPARIGRSSAQRHGVASRKEHA